MRTGNSGRAGPICFDENSVSPSTRGDFRGFEGGNKPTPALRDRRSSGEGFSSLHPLQRWGFSWEFFMPPGGARFDENTVPFGQGGLQGGFGPATEPPR